MTFTDIAVFAAIVTLLRIITYQRRGSRHRPLIAWLAWLVACIHVVLIVKLPVTPLPTSATVVLAMLTVAGAVLLLRASGNIAECLRLLRVIRRS